MVNSSLRGSTALPTRRGCYNYDDLFASVLSRPFRRLSTIAFRFIAYQEKKRHDFDVKKWEREDDKEENRYWENLT